MFHLLLFINCKLKFLKFFTKSYQNLGSPFVLLFVIIEAGTEYINFFQGSKGKESWQSVHFVLAV